MQLTHSEEKWGSLMYIKQKNKTAIRSQHMIADALFSLMRRKPFQQISVTEICTEAGIGRKTFYRHFEMREDVIEFQLENMRMEYQNGMNGLTLEERLYYHFSYTQKNADLLIALYKNGLTWLVYEKFCVLRPELLPVWSHDPVEQEYRCEYIIAGIEAIQRVWISRGCKESIDEVVEMARRAQEKQIPIG